MESTLIIMEKLQDRLTRVMSHYGLSVKQIADKAGVSRQAIDLMLKGETKNPKSSVVNNLSNTLEGLNPQWLLDGTGEMIIESKETNQRGGNSTNGTIGNNGGSFTKEGSEIYPEVVAHIELEDFARSIGFSVEEAQSPQLRKGIIKLYLKHINLKAEQSKVKAEETKIEAFKKIFGL